MSAGWVFAMVVSHLLAALVAFGVGRRVLGRRRYNAGVAAGREFAERQFGLPHEDVRPARPRRRFLIRSDRQPEPGPLVTRDAPVLLSRPYFTR